MAIFDERYKVDRWDIKRTIEKYDAQGYHCEDIADDLAHHFDVYRREVPKPRLSFIQRLNHIWFVPLFILWMPIGFILFGKYELNPNSRIGRAVKWLVGS